MNCKRHVLFPRVAVLLIFIQSIRIVSGADHANKTHQHFLWTKAIRIPAELTSEESGYFSIVEGKNGRIYIGTAKYGDNAYLVELDPESHDLNVVVDAEKEIGIDRKGFAAQAKFHTRNNVGRSGRIYLGTKQGYPLKGEKRTDYLGGYPMVFDPVTGMTRVYDVPVKHHGVISVAPDESRGIAYVSTCDDARPIESTHFMILDLKSGTYRDLMDCRHMYAFIVVDHLGRAYHPVLGGLVARYDPRTERLQQLQQTIDGENPQPESLLADPKSHPINWDISPDRKTLYAVAMSGNQLYAYDLTGEGDSLEGRRLGPLIAGAEKTDCRAMCVAPDGRVWAGVAATFRDRGQFLHVVSWNPGDKTPTDHGPLAIGNPDYATFNDSKGKTKPWHHGVYQLPDGKRLPRYVIMGICAATDGTVYLTTLYPFTVHAIRIPQVAGITTEYRHNAHADMFLTRMLKTDRLNETGARVPMNLKSIHTDQTPANDTSRNLASQHHVRVSATIDDALTLGTDSLAVDGVFLIAEHGNYPESDTGQFQFPKKRMFAEVTKTFRKSKRVVPVFHDKHLADTWDDAKWIYDQAKELQIPMMAGSSLPGSWRYPPLDVKRGESLRQIVITSYHRLDSYGFHALEVVQALAERRKGGETGVASVQCLSGDAVWKAADHGVYDRRLLDAALSRLKEKPLREGQTIEALCKHPDLLVINYKDGLRACVFSLEYAVLEWSAAWQYEGSEEIQSTLFWTQELRPFMHFSWMLMDIGKMMQTGKPVWPLERTLMTSGLLDALLTSKRDGGKKLSTPWLNIHYQSDWNWSQPPQPPPGRPITEQ